MAQMMIARTSYTLKVIFGKSSCILIPANIPMQLRIDIAAT